MSNLRSQKPETVADRMKVSSTSPPPIVQYVIENRINGGQWTEVGRVLANQQNSSMADLLGGIEYECRIVSVDGDGCRQVGCSSSFQLSSPKILAPTTRVIPVQAVGLTQFDVKYSGYPPPYTLWMYMDGQPLSDNIRCQYSNSGGHSISSLLISPLADGFELKPLKFKIENSLGRDEATFDLVVVADNMESPKIPDGSLGRKREAVKWKGDLDFPRPPRPPLLRATQMMDSAHEYVEITWTPPNVVGCHFDVERMDASSPWTIINSKPLTGIKYHDYNVAVGRTYHYRVNLVTAQGIRVTSRGNTVNMKGQWNGLMQSATGIGYGCNGGTTSQGPVVKIPSTTPMLAGAQSSEWGAKITKMEEEVEDA